PPRPRPGSGLFLIFRQMRLAWTLPMETAIILNHQSNAMKSPARTGVMIEARPLALDPRAMNAPMSTVGLTRLNPAMGHLTAKRGRFPALRQAYQGLGLLIASADNGLRSRPNGDARVMTSLRAIPAARAASPWKAPCRDNAANDVRVGLSRRPGNGGAVLSLCSTA
ncbi:MAG: hypothetical protein WD152_04995, partial [Nitriliruptoraceae bacterium]